LVFPPPPTSGMASLCLLASSDLGRDQITLPI
jgi:hypothetical protein